MKEELLKQLLPIVEKTKEGLIKGIDILQEQCPLLVQEVLRWNFVMSLISFVMVITLILTTIILLSKEHKRTTTKDSRYTFFENPFPYAVPCVVTGIVSLLTLMAVSISETGWVWLKILIAPKLFLLEYITNLLK